MLLTHDQFLEQLGSLMGESKGSVFMTLKRYDFEGTAGGEDTDMTSTEPSSSTSTYPYLARVTNGHKLKISTQVMPDEYEAFTSRFTTLMKSNMAPRMKKKDKKRQNQQQSTAANSKASNKAARSIGTTVVPKIKGSARGAGRDKRQRSVKARQRVVDRFKQKKAAQEAASARLDALKRSIEASAESNQQQQSIVST